MPPTRYFVVTQERQVRVSAPSVIEAAQCAAKVFAGEDLAVEHVEQATPRSPIVDRKLSVEEDR